MRREAVWAVTRKEIEEFFRQQRDVETAERGFRFGSCAIVLEALPPKGEGFWAMPQTWVCMEGPEQALEQIYRRFFLRFLSAGG